MPHRCHPAARHTVPGRAVAKQSRGWMVQAVLAGKTGRIGQARHRRLRDCTVCSPTQPRHPAARWCAASRVKGRGGPCRALQELEGSRCCRPPAAAPLPGSPRPPRPIACPATLLTRLEVRDSRLSAPARGAGDRAGPASQCQAAAAAAASACLLHSEHSLPMARAAHPIIRDGARVGQSDRRAGGVRQLGSRCDRPI